MKMVSLMNLKKDNVLFLTGNLEILQKNSDNYKLAPSGVGVYAP